MNYLTQLTDQDFENMAQYVETISKKDESEIYRIIGNSLNREGYTVAESSGFDIIQPIMMVDAENKRLNTMKAFNFVSKSIPISQENAEDEGKRFYQRFKDKLNQTICNDSKIKEIITGNGTFKDYLIAGIPIVISALGLTALNPVLLVIIVSIFALIFKVGFKAYCEIA